MKDIICIHFRELLNFNSNITHDTYVQNILFIKWLPLVAQKMSNLLLSFSMNFNITEALSHL